MKYFYSDIQCIHIFVTRSKTNDYSNSNPFTNQRITNGFEIKTSHWAVTSEVTSHILSDGVTAGFRNGTFRFYLPVK